MRRRTFMLVAAVSLTPVAAFAANRKFVFKIRTKTGGIIGGVLIEAKDMEAAKYKLRKRYPDCEILEAKEK